MFVQSDKLYLALSTNSDLSLASDDASEIEICGVLSGWAYMVFTLEQSITDSSKQLFSAFIVVESGTANPIEFSQGKKQTS